MAKILFGTHYISEDEPCLLLTEVNMPLPNKPILHRFQSVLVMRDNKPAEYRKDLGKSTPQDQIRIPGGAYDDVMDKYYVEHTVGELRQMAEQLRANPSFKKGELKHVEGANLLSQYAEQRDQKNNMKKGRVLIGK